MPISRTSDRQALMRYKNEFPDTVWSDQTADTEDKQKQLILKEIQQVNEAAGLSGVDIWRKYFLNLPAEMITKLFDYLEGASFLALCEVCPETKAVITEILGKGDKRVTYWRNTSFWDMPSSLLLKVLASFDTVIEPTKRIDEGSVMKDPRYIYTWEDVYYSMHDYTGRMLDWDFEVTALRELEKKIKVDHTIQCRFRRQAPMRHTITTGSTLLNMVLPHRQPIIVLENFMEFRREMSACPYPVSYLKIWHFPLPTTPNDNPLSPLPRVIKICICVCLDCINFLPISEGLSTKLSFNQDTFSSYVDTSDPIVATSNDIVGVWGKSTWLKIYRGVWNDRFLELQIVKEIQPQYEIIHLWKMRYNTRGHWIAQIGVELIPVYTYEKDKDYYQTTQQDPPVRETYNLEMISPKLGKYIIGCPDMDGVSLRRTYPGYYSCATGVQNILNSDGVTPKSANEYGSMIFWNNEVMTMSWDGITWLFKKWENVLNEKDEDEGNEMDFIAPNNIEVAIAPKNLLIVGYNRTVLIVEIYTEPSRQITGIMRDARNIGTSTAYVDPCLQTIILRRIPIVTNDVLASSDPLGNLMVTNLTFDFNLGMPYIFVELNRNPNHRGIRSFRLVKISVKPPRQAESGDAKIDSSTGEENEEEEPNDKLSKLLTKSLSIEA